MFEILSGFGRLWKLDSVNDLNMLSRSRNLVWVFLSEVSLYASTILSLAEKIASLAEVNLFGLVSSGCSSLEEGESVISESTQLELLWIKQIQLHCLIACFGS